MTQPIHAKRMTATLEGDFVIFLIGMRINAPLKLHKWLPVAASMPRMLKELKAQPALGYLNVEMWFSRNIVMVQYWRSMAQLMDYAKNREAQHLPAWQAFNKQIGTNGDVGIWHETYDIKAGQYENIYVNMPPFGMGKAGQLTEITTGKHGATERINANARAR